MKISKFVSIILLIVVLCTGIVAISTGCKKQPKKAVYEIKLYDNDWNELVKNDNGIGYKWDYYVFEADGTPRGFNAKAFKDGVEFYTFNYYDLTYIYDNVLVVFVNDSSVDPKGGGFPRDRGTYYLSYTFYEKYFEGMPEYMFPDDPFPRNYEQEIRIIIK